MNFKIFIVIWVLYFQPLFTLSQEQTQSIAKDKSSDIKTIYKYKKEDYFDFDALSVKGSLLSPSDISSKRDKKVRFEPKKYLRKDFDESTYKDMLEVY